MHRNICILYSNVHIFYIQLIYTLQDQKSNSGTVIHYVGWGKSPKPQDIHCFKGNSVFNLWKFFQERNPGIKRDLHVYHNLWYCASLKLCLYIQNFYSIWICYFYFLDGIFFYQWKKWTVTGLAAKYYVKYWYKKLVWSTWCNNVIFHLSICCIPNKWWPVTFKKKNVWCMTSLSEIIKPVKSVKTLMTDESWKAIINRHLKGSRNI